MFDRLVIERLEFKGHCGITAEERAVAQPIAIDIEVEYRPDILEAAASSGDIAQAVDYARIAERVIQVATGEVFVLVETMAVEVMNMLMTEFSVSRARVWVRKLAPPLKSVSGSVGIRLDRSRSWSSTGPARFLLDQMPRLPKGTVLDVACGSGRNALYLATRGFTVEGLDQDEQALAALTAEAGRRNLRNISARKLDLEARPEIPTDRYDAIITFFYLYRPLVPLLVHALKPGGVLVYETFLIDNHLRHGHPRRREFCLSHNELLHLGAGLRILFYDEGEHEGGHGDGFAFTARLVAQKEVSHESDQ